MTNAERRETIDQRQAAVGEWIRLAVNHAQAAHILRRAASLQAQRLFMVQQSIEDAVKAIARNAGLSHKEVREYSHDILGLFVWYHSHVISTTRTAPYIDDLLANCSASHKEYNVVTQIDNLRVLTTSDRDPKHLDEHQRKAAEQFFESALTVSPQEISALLDLSQGLNKLRNNARVMVKKVTRKPLVFDLSLHNERSFFDQVFDQARGRLDNMSDDQAASMERLIQHLVGQWVIDNGEDDFRAYLAAANGGMFAFDKDKAEQILTMFEIPIALMQMLIVAALVWPHESYPRYVAPPEASLDFREAAKNTYIGFKALLFG